MPVLRDGHLVLGVLALLAGSGIRPARARSVLPTEQILPAREMGRVMADPEVEAHASLDDLAKPAGLKRYSFRTVMLVHAPLGITRRILTQYALYPKMISYIHRADFDAKTGVLGIEGGIFNWVLRSWIRFEDRGEKEIHYRIVAGHFTGMEGDFEFVPEGERGTLVSMTGEITGKNFPPTFVIEQGAEIVFGYTAKRMRSYIESQLEPPPRHAKETHDAATPQPRSHL